MKIVKVISPLLTKYSARDWREILQLEKVGKARLPKNSSAVDMTMDIDTADSQELKELQFSLPLVSGGRKPLAVATLLERLKVNSPFLLVAWIASSSRNLIPVFWIVVASRTRRMRAE